MHSGALLTHVLGDGTACAVMKQMAHVHKLAGSIVLSWFRQAAMHIRGSCHCLGMHPAIPQMYRADQGKHVLPHRRKVLDKDAQQQQRHAHNGDHTPSRVDSHLLSQQERALSSSLSSSHRALLRAVCP